MERRLAIKKYCDLVGIDCHLPGIAGAYQGKKLIICGDAYNIWIDLENFGCKSTKGRGGVYKDGWDMMTLNKLVQVFPGNIEHTYSNHIECLKTALASRREEYRKDFIEPRNSHSCFAGMQWKWPWSGHGTSALGACLAALAMGYSEIMLAGIPMDDKHHNGEPDWRRCVFETKDRVSENERIKAHWDKAMKVFDGKVRSLSGRTREWLA